MLRQGFAVQGLPHRPLCGLLAILNRFLPFDFSPFDSRCSLRAGRAGSSVRNDKAGNQTSLKKLDFRSFDFAQDKLRGNDKWWGKPQPTVMIRIT